MSIEITQLSLWLLYIGCHLQFRSTYSPWRPFGSSGWQIFSAVSPHSHRCSLDASSSVFPDFHEPGVDRPLTWRTFSSLLSILCDILWVKLRVGKFHWRILSSTSAFPSTDFKWVTSNTNRMVVYHIMCGYVACVPDWAGTNINPGAVPWGLCDPSPLWLTFFKLSRILTLPFTYFFVRPS